MMHDENRRPAFGAAIIVGFCAAFVPAAAKAQADERVSGWGAGLFSCAQFAQFYRAKPDQVENMFFSWTQGYLTAMNQSLVWEGSKKQINLDKWSSDDEKAFIRDWCASNPLDQYAMAVLKMVEKAAASR